MVKCTIYLKSGHKITTNLKFGYIKECIKNKIPIDYLNFDNGFIKYDTVEAIFEADDNE